MKFPDEKNKTNNKNVHFNSLQNFFELIKNNFYTLVKLNFLYSLSYLPIILLLLLISEKHAPLPLKLLLIFMCVIPLGPTTIGMFKIIFDLLMRKPVFLFSDFLDAVRQNWREGLILCTLDFSIAVIISIELPFFFNMMLGDAFGIILLIFSILFSLTVFFSNCYLLVMIPALDTSFLNKIKNAFLVSMLGTLNNIFILFCTSLIFTVIILLFPLSLIFYSLFIPVLLGSTIMLSTWPLIKKWCIPPEVHD